MNTQTKELTLREHGDKLISPIMSEIQAGLPPTISPDRFRAAFLTAMNAAPAIRKCSPQSIRNALLKCAADGLVPDGRQAALVPFKDECQYIPMVQGIIARAQELGSIDRISAQCVYENDKFLWRQGDDETIEHVPPSLGIPRGSIIGAYAIFWSNSRVIHREVMDLEAINKTRAVSRAKNSPAWENWYPEMARKAVIRRGSKYIPMNQKLREIIEREDEFVEFDQRRDQPPGIIDRVRAAGSKATNIVEHVERETGDIIDADPASRPDWGEDEPVSEGDDFPGDRR